MSNLKVGDLVMVGGAASAEDRAKNAGRFRTVLGFVLAGFRYKDKKGDISERALESAVLDNDLFNYVLEGPYEGDWEEEPYKSVAQLVKINPGDAEDETLTWVGKPNKQTEPDKEVV